jgi:hypothetical protein
MNPYKSPMNLIQLPYESFIGGKSGFMGDFSSFMVHTIVCFEKKIKIFRDFAWQRCG